MAIQAHIYSDNLGLPVSSQDYFFMNNNNFINNTNNNMNNINNNLLYSEFNFNNLQLQYQQQQQQQQQQQYMIHLQNMQKRNPSVNNGGFMFLQPSKKQKLVNNTATTTTTTSTTTSESNIHISMNFSQSFSVELEKQRQEIDKYITLQNDRLKLVLQEQRKQQLGLAIKKLEAKALQLLRQKDDEISEATKKSMEFQEIIRKLEIENQAWQRVASQNEEMVLSLNNTLEQLQQQQACSSSSSNCVDDVESCCNISDNNKNNFKVKEETCCVSETGENRGVFSSKLCKVCKTRNACILMLPCRHLCSCKSCDAVIDACPVCKSPKTASIEAIIS